MQVEIDFKYLDNLTSLLSKIKWTSGVLINSIECCVSGGAIRDMLLQKPVSDIDVFYTGVLKEVLINKQFKNVKPGLTSYPNGFNVKYTVMDSFFPVPIQLIQVQDIEKHIATFPTNMSRVSYSIEKGLEGLDSDFIYNVTRKEFLWDHKVEEHYYYKIKDKYSDWKHIFLNEADSPEHEEEHVEF